MRANSPLLAVVSLLTLAACSSQTTRWEKPQATAEAVAADLRDCRIQAQREAFRSVGLGGPWRYGYPYFGSPYFGASGVFYDARLRNEQYFAENRLTAFCMQNKGYERVVVEQPET